MGRGLTKAGQELKYLTVEEIIKIHEVSMQKFGGGEPGIFKEGKSRIESVIERMKEGYFNHQPFDSLVKKTAFMFQSLLIYHPFVDGMKRTGIYSSLAFLLRNNYLLISTSVEDSVSFAVSVADDMRELEPEESLEIITGWFNERIIKLDDSDAILKHFHQKGKRFKCPKCGNENVAIETPYCRDCGNQITGFSIAIDGIILREELQFSRKAEPNPELMRKLPGDRLSLGQR